MVVGSGSHIFWSSFNAVPIDYTWLTHILKFDVPLTILELDYRKVSIWKYIRI